ncbi:MAG TPA: YifB family Mg chelatase-like AAA ATPase [Clostridiales bacterium]|nr:YifB family Mg chelatase-like AAA ATPase [Clostridiales bacterium]
MVAKIWTVGLRGIEGYRMSVECDLSGGLPAFDIVGLPDASVREARERVRSALKNKGFDFPLRRITVNLAPADTKKAGALYDLPILLALLAASGQVEGDFSDAAFIGEVSLDGNLRPVRGTLPAAVAAKAAGFKRFYVPLDNAGEAALAGEEIDVFGVSAVDELAEVFLGKRQLAKAAPADISEPSYEGLDFSEVKGQQNAKRACEIAAAGGHNLLFSGPPGAGKSMLAKRIASILPEMTREEALETTKIYSVAGLTGREQPLVARRPFRSPHHTLSPVSLAGGGTDLRPGEISLAHNGVLFLDEFPEFSRTALEVLRQPLEDGVVTISRASGTVQYPCRFMLVGAMNPCRCGWFGHPSGRCTCSRSSVESYRRHVSGPMLDRIDIFVDIPEVSFTEITAKSGGQSSAEIRTRVDRARKIQAERLEGTGVFCNAYLPPALLDRFCALEEAERALLRLAFERLNLSARSYTRILKLSRTIADLDQSERIKATHISEALQYRPPQL